MFSLAERQQNSAQLCQFQHKPRLRLRFLSHHPQLRSSTRLPVDTRLTRALSFEISPVTPRNPSSSISVLEVPHIRPILLNIILVLFIYQDESWLKDDNGSGLEGGWIPISPCTWRGLQRGFILHIFLALVVSAY